MKRFLLALLLLLSLGATAQAETLTVSAAASLTDAFTDIEPAFEAANPGVDVIMNFAASGALYRQIEQGAPVDVFASANPKWMNKAVEGGFAEASAQRVFAHNDLVLAAPKGNPAGVTAVDSLKDAKVKAIGVGTPETVPAGQYARDALTGLGVWDELTPKYIFCESVRQVLDYLSRGEVDAGFVYRTDAVKAGEAVEIIVDIPLKKPVTYPIAALKQSANGKLAQAFVDFILSPKGQELLAARGFSPATK